LKNSQIYNTCFQLYWDKCDLLYISYFRSFNLNWHIFCLKFYRICQSFPWTHQSLCLAFPSKCVSTDWLGWKFSCTPLTWSRTISRNEIWMNIPYQLTALPDSSWLPAHPGHPSHQRLRFSWSTYSTQLSWRFNI